jgi:hypothetical protein
MPESTPNYRDLFRRAVIYADKMVTSFLESGLIPKPAVEGRARAAGSVRAAEG